MAQLLRPPCEDRPFDRTASETGDCSARARPFVLAATILGSSMAFIDGSALTVALPVLRAEFDADLASVQWVINAYVLSLAAFTLIGGSLADRLGRRNVFVWGVAVFAVASLACAFAPSLEVLSAARFLQGVGAALLTPASLALISSAYPRNERSLAIGTWAAASAITGAVGPVLGGWLTERFGWPSIFLLNIPFALGAVFLAVRYAPEGKPVQAGGHRLDWIGAVLAAIGFGLAFRRIANGQKNSAERERNIEQEDGR
ncbi:MAG: MFS transporter, partial [Pseudomonadota bacterium]